MVLTNLSLQHNTIGLVQKLDLMSRLGATKSAFKNNNNFSNASKGTYQVLKCLADPLFVGIQALFYKKHYPRAVKLSLIPMICGIVLNRGQIKLAWCRYESCRTIQTNIFKSFCVRSKYRFGLSLPLVLNSWFDLKYSAIGTAYALAAVIVTAIYTVVRYLYPFFIVFWDKKSRGLNT